MKSDASPTDVLADAIAERIIPRVVEAVIARFDRLRADEDDVLTRDEAAKLLKMEPTTVVRYVKTAGLPASKVGPEWRFRKSEILAWLKNCAVERGAHTARAARRLRAAKEVA